MKSFKLTSLFALIIAGMFLFTACEETTKPVDPVKPKPEAPKNLKATSLDASKIKLLWEASSSESDTLFLNYYLEITAVGGGAPLAPIEIDKNNKPFIVSGLNEGTVYTFKLFAKNKNGELSTNSTQVSWSPATRFIHNENDDPIQVFETASSFGSGLDLYNPATGKPRGLKVASGADWDLGLYTTGGVLQFGSASQLPYNYTGTPAPTDISINYFDAASLDEVYDSEALNATKHTYNPLVIDLNTDVTVTKGLVLLVRKMEPGNDKFTYAKVFIKKQNGQFLQGASDNRFLLIEVSYQKTAGVPYAKKPVM